MKLALVMLCSLITPAIAQDQPRPQPQGLTPTYGFPTSVAPANLREFRISPNVKANYILHDGATITAAGEVQIRTGTVTVHADRAVVNTDTGEIQASGNVRIIPLALPAMVVFPATLPPSAARPFSPPNQ